MRVGRLAVLAVAAVVGCDDGAPSAGAVRAALEEQLPEARFERDGHLRLGRVVMALARGVVGIVEDDPELRRTLSHVRRMEIASYLVENLPDLSAVGLPEGLERRMQGAGWQSVVRTRDPEELVWIFVRPRPDGSIANLYIVDLDPQELTVIDLRGRLDELVAEAIADDPRGFAGRVGA